MLIVADTSPFIGLIKIGHIDIFPKLFGNVVIPPQVAAELASAKRPMIVREFIASAPAWLSIRTPTKLESIPDIDPGELAAISLAKELKADLLLIDDAKGRQAALARNIPTARTAAVLFDAANAGVIADLEAAFNKLKATNFRVSAKILDQLLQLHRQLKQGQT